MSGALNPLNLISPVLALTGLFKSKPKPQPAPLPPVQIRSNSAAADVLANRRGSRANQRTGPGGAEAASGGKTKLGQ